MTVVKTFCVLLVVVQLVLSAEFEAKKEIEAFKQLITYEAPQEQAVEKLLEKLPYNSNQEELSKDVYAKIDNLFGLPDGEGIAIEPPATPNVGLQVGSVNIYINGGEQPVQSVQVSCLSPDIVSPVDETQVVPRSKRAIDSYREFQGSKSVITEDVAVQTEDGGSPSKQVEEQNINCRPNIIGSVQFGSMWKVPKLNPVVNKIVQVVKIIVNIFKALGSPLKCFRICFGRRRPVCGYSALYGYKTFRNDCNFKREVCKGPYYDKIRNGNC